MARTTSAAGLPSAETPRPSSITCTRRTPIRHHQQGAKALDSTQLVCCAIQKASLLGSAQTTRTC